RHRIRNTRTLHNQVRVKQQRFGVFAAFVSDVVKQQHLFVIVPDFARIRYKDVKTLLFTQNGRSYAAFASAKYYESLHLSAVSGLRWIKSQAKFQQSRSEPRSCFRDSLSSGNGGVR